MIRCCMCRLVRGLNTQCSLACPPFNLDPVCFSYQFFSYHLYLLSFISFFFLSDMVVYWMGHTSLEVGVFGVGEGRGMHTHNTWPHGPLTNSSQLIVADPRRMWDIGKGFLKPHVFEIVNVKTHMFVVFVCSLSHVWLCSWDFPGKNTGEGRGLPQCSAVKNHLPMQETRAPSLDQEEPLGEEMATQSIEEWATESMGSQKCHDLPIKLFFQLSKYTCD